MAGMAVNDGQCIPGDACGQKINNMDTLCRGKACDADADNKGCGDGMQCATAPPDLAKSCVSSDACDNTAAGETDDTKCGATSLAATFLAAFAMAANM